MKFEDALDLLCDGYIDKCNPKEMKDIMIYKAETLEEQKAELAKLGVLKR